MISGAMPKWKRILDTCAMGFMGLLFVGIGAMGARFVLPLRDSSTIRGMRAVAVLFVLMAVAAIWAQLWFRRRIIREFEYDGKILRFRTLGVSETQERAPSQFVDILDWKGRFGPMGYQLIFRDAPKAYLGYDVANTVVLIEQLRRDVPGIAL